MALTFCPEEERSLSHGSEYFKRYHYYMITPGGGGTPIRWDTPTLGRQGYGLHQFLYQRGQGFESLYQRGQGFSVTNVYQRGQGFSKNLCLRGYFCKYSALRANFSHVFNILNFRNCVKLHKILQWIMFSSSCTTKGVDLQDSCTREGMVLARNVY